MFWILLLLLAGFAIYLFSQTTVKNHNNYPVVFAMVLGIAVYMSSSALPQWIIENLNKHFHLGLSAYEPITKYEMWGIWAFLIILVIVFYSKNKKENSNNFINKFFSLFNFGTIINNQTNLDSATKEDTEEIKQKLDQLLQQSSNPALSKEEKEKLEKEILRLRRELIAHSIDDKGVKEAENIMLSQDRDRVDKALAAIDKYNSKEQIAKLKEQQSKQAKILQYKATLYEEKKDWSNAKASYKEALEFEDSYDNNFNYAYFLQTKSPRDREEVSKYYKIALAKASSKTQKATTLNNLANFYADDSTKRTEAEKYYKEALKIYRALAKENREVYLPDVATILNNLALFYAKDSTKRSEAEKYYKEALEIRRALAKENREVYLPDVAMTLNNLANFYSKDSTKRTEPEKYYKEALEIYRALAKENREVYGLDYANTLVMGVALFSAPKEQLDEANKLLLPFPDNYANVGFLRRVIKELR